jgi:hypothetical protein
MIEGSSSVQVDEIEMLDHYDFSHGVRGKYYNPTLSEQSPVIRLLSETDDRTTTFETIEVMANVDAHGKLTAQLPQSIEAGEYRVVMMIERSIETK